MKYLLMCCFVLFSINLQAQDEVTVAINPGWNMISINVVPGQDMWRGGQGPDIVRMYGEIVNQIELVKAEDGTFYAPIFGFNNIDFWDLTKGYLVLNRGNAFEYTWEGDRIAADADVQLNRLWNLVSYLPEYNLDAGAEDFYVLSPIIDHVLLAADDQGNVMIPEHNFSNMPPWTAGEGYVILVDEDIVLNYPEEVEENQFLPIIGNHWEYDGRSDIPMFVLIQDLAGINPGDGDQIMAIDENGESVGVGSFQEDGMCGFAVYGADNNNQFPGLDRGEAFSLMYWNEALEEETAVQVEEFLEGEQLTYSSFSLVVVAVSVELEQENARANLDLAQGWNMISINVDPDPEFYAEGENRGPDVERMMEQLRIDEENHHLILMKDENGQFYTPGPWYFSNIPYWDLGRGYMVKMDSDISTGWSGMRIDPQAEIALREGWNMIPYYPEYELSLASPDFIGIADILEDVTLMKDGFGNFAIPEHNFSNMPNLRPSQGYLINMNAEAALVYPVEGEDAQNARTEKANPGYMTPTSENMSVLLRIDGEGIGDNVQVNAKKSDGQIIGVGAVNPENLCGIAIWGDDQATTEIDGMVSGESFTLHLFDPASGESTLLQDVEVVEGKGLTYETNGFTALQACIAPTAPSEVSLSENYPDPFNAVTRFDYSLSSQAKISIRVYDTAGRTVEALFDGLQSAGRHQIAWEAAQADAGVYFVELKVADYTSVRKVVLVR